MCTSLTVCSQVLVVGQTSETVHFHFLKERQYFYVVVIWNERMPNKHVIRLLVKEDTDILQYKMVDNVLQAQMQEQDMICTEDHISVEEVKVDLGQMMFTTRTYHILFLHL